MKKIILSLITIGLLASCDFLDVIPAGKATEEDLFKTHIQADNFATSLFNYMPDRMNLQASPDFAAGGDIVSSFYGSVRYFKWKSWIYDNLETPSNTYYAFWSQSAPKYPDGVWFKHPWKGIRNAYLLLQNAEKVKDASAEEVSRWKGEAYWLIAYLHQSLLELYGPIPLVKEMRGLNEPINDERRPYLECVQFISDMYDKSVEFLPNKQPTHYYGRPTKTCALALKARLWLYAASPMINGNTEWYADFKNNDGTPLIPQTYDKELWKTAMDAAEAAIKQGEADGFGLYDESKEENMFDRGYQNMRETFIGKAGTTKSYNHKEHLFSWCLTWYYNTMNFGPRHKYTSKFTPGGKIQYYRDGWRGYFVPTMEAVDCFLTENGLPWEDDPTTKDIKKTDLAAVPGVAGEVTAQMHLHREPRFYAAIGYDRGFYDMDGETFMLRCRRGEESQYDGNHANEYQTATGYYIKKWVKKEDSFNYESNKFSWNNYAYPYIRMAEVYMDYAEAEAAYTGSLSAKGQAYLDKVRHRAGIPSFANAWEAAGGIPTGAKLLQVIRQERLAEFIFEGRWFHDLRRWKKIGMLANTPHGWNLAGKTAEDFYKITEIEEGAQHRTFSVPKNVWLAIPQDQLNINSNLVQNPGY